MRASEETSGMALKLSIKITEATSVAKSFSRREVIDQCVQQLLLNPPLNNVISTCDAKPHVLCIGCLPREEQESVRERIEYGLSHPGPF